MSTRTAAAITKIEDWLKQRGYELKPGKAYVCYSDEKRVTYRPGDPVATQVHGLLHECGHVLINRTVARGRGTRYLRGYPCTRTRGARPNVSAADLVDEEISAWHRGFNLAKRLRIRLDADAYWRDYGVCIKHYFRRAIARRI